MQVERNPQRECPFQVQGLEGTPDFLSQVCRPLFICSFWTRSVEWCQKFVFSDEPFDAPEASHEDLGHRRLTLGRGTPRGQISLANFVRKIFEIWFVRRARLQD
jgi:hypothetical protein